MALLARHVTVLAAVLALSGFQVVLAACTALCVDRIPVSTAPHHPSPDVDGVDHSPATGHHGHHASTDASDVPPAASRLAGSAAPTVKAVKGSCGSCCPDASPALVSGPRVERVGALVLALVSTTAPWRLAATVGRTPPPSGPSVSPPLPVGAPVPLRI